MKKILILPGRYVQGPGIMREIGAELASIGDNVFITGGNRALGNTRDAIMKSLDERGINCSFELFNGENSKQEIIRMQKLASAYQSNVIMGVGGGKVIDLVKVVADNLNLPVVIVPTIAANDAPCSALSVVYTEDGGAIDDFIMIRQNPRLVFVDTQVIANAPVRYLVAGMGDALATRFEAEACAASGSTNISGGHTTAAALAIARLCYDILINYGYLAKTSCEQGVTGMALEKVVEANILLSGIGFESAGLAAAHAIQDGFSELAETHDRYHGEKVAFSTLAQLVLQNSSMELLNEVYGFCHSVGLPLTLAEIGVVPPLGEKLMKAARIAEANPIKILQNMPFPVSTQDVYNAIMVADALGTAFHAKGKVG